jgi:hypothetical protein
MATHAMITVTEVLPNWANSALYSVGSNAELLFVHRQDGNLHSKFVRPHDVARAYSRTQFDTGDIPDGVRRFGYGASGMWVIYVRPAQMVDMIFREEDPLHVPIPPTMLVGVGKSYRIFAIDNPQADLGEVKVFHAPFDNVYEDGRICWGSNAVPAISSAEIAPLVWELFFRAPFTHRNDNHQGHATTTSEMYAKLAKSKASRFRGKLRPIHISIQYLINSFDKNQGDED